MPKLKMCPCGKIPEKLCLGRGTIGFYAYAYADCCGDWQIEFKAKYEHYESDACMELAVKAWNNVKRGTDGAMQKGELIQKLKRCPCGGIPHRLGVSRGSIKNWAIVYADCCVDWEIEFKTNYEYFESEKCMELAIKAWNNAKRKGE